MQERPFIGGRLRGLRRKANMTQAMLAERLEISPSYLNLLENNRRPITAPLLIRIAQVLDLDIKTLATDDPDQLSKQLREVFDEPLFDDLGITVGDVQELSATQPALARAVLTMYREYRAARESADALSEAVTDGGTERARLASEEISDLLQRHMNHFPSLEEAAEDLVSRANLTRDTMSTGLIRELKDAHGVTVRIVKSNETSAVRKYSPEKKELQLSELLAPRSRIFHLALQLALLSYSDVITRATQDEVLTSDGSRTLARIALANYIAAAVIMPYRGFLDEARAERYDVELLGHRFRASFEQVCHRLTTLRRPGAEGVPFHFIRVDIAGNISKRFSGSGISFARFSGACPRWNIHAAFSTPGMIRTQISEMPDGTRYFCVARTVRDDRGGYHALHAVNAIGLGCDLKYGKELVYAVGMDLGDARNVVPVGVTCRLCERMDCEQRAFPPLRRELAIDENVRGITFYRQVLDKALPVVKG